MATNIVNSSTGKTGYQVPGAALPAGWTASPSQVSNAISTGLSNGSTGGGGAVNTSGQIVNSSGAVVGTANPKDIPGYVPGTLPGDRVSSATPPGQTPPINTSQPSPSTVNATPSTDATSTSTPSGIPGMPDLTGSNAEQATQAIDQLKQKYGKALTDITGTGVEAPASAGSAAAGITTALNSQPPPQSPTPTTTANVDNFFDPEANPAIQESTQQLQDFLSPPQTRQDMSDAMSKLSVDQSALTADKLDLMNMKNVMAGTEGDLRDEVTAANGFATESQIQALAVSRNKTLLKQASFLQDQVASLQDSVANDTTLLNFEKEMANTQFTQRLGILNYQQTNYNNQMNAARDSLKTIAATVGYDGLYKAVANDPVQVARDEQVLGLASGGLKQLADAPNTGAIKDALEIQGLRLDNQKKTADLASNAGTGTPAVLSPYTHQAYDGTQYADLSSLTPSDKAKYAQIAQNAGIKPILDAGTAGKINAISDSKANLQKIEDSVSTILNDDSIGAVQGSANSLKSLLGNADIKAFSAWRTAVINNVQALAGGQGSGLRINQAEIDTALKNDLPVITGAGADNLAQAKAKIANLNSQLDTWTKQILGGGNTAAGGQSASTSAEPKLLAPTEIPAGFYQASDGKLYAK